jgi:hypothetical protein
MRNKTRLIIFILAGTLLLSACIPGVPTEVIQTLTPADILSQVGTAVAQTLDAQNQVNTSVAQTLQSQITVTATITETPVPSLTPVFIPSPTRVPSSGGGGGSSPKPEYACIWREVYPRYNVIRPGEDFDVVWIITNTGTKNWPAGKDLDYVNGPVLSPYAGEELPAMKSGDSVTIAFVATAPTEKGLYGMQFKVEGGLCWPALNIQVGK